MFIALMLRFLFIFGFWRLLMICLLKVRAPQVCVPEPSSSYELRAPLCGAKLRDFLGQSKLLPMDFFKFSFLFMIPVFLRTQH